MTANASVSTAALSTLGNGAIWRTIVKRATLVNETCTTSPPRFLKHEQRHLRIFHQNVGRLPGFRNSIFRFHTVRRNRRLVTSRRKRTPANCWQNLGQFPHLPDNRVTRRRIQSRNIKITPYPQLFITYPRLVRSLVLRSKG